MKHWIAYQDRHPMFKDHPIIGGSYRTNTITKERYWSQSSVFEYPSTGIDDDRTHWMSVPKPPTRKEAQYKKPKGKLGK